MLLEDILAAGLHTNGELETKLLGELEKLSVVKKTKNNEMGHQKVT